MLDNEVSRIAARKAYRRRRRRIILGMLVVLSTGLFVLSPAVNTNFGVVDPGRVYRSAQPGRGFERLVREKRIASVLNLRGGSPADTFYANETKVVSATGVDFYDFPMSASRRPSRRELLILIDFFSRCEYPLLIHCKSGSDRTGLVSAVYLMIEKSVGPVEAERALHWSYWHFPVGGAQRLHEPIDEYATWLETNRLAHSPARFRSWVEHEYASQDTATDVPPLRKGPREWLSTANPMDAGSASLR